MEAIFALMFIGVAVMFKILVNEEKNTRAQWKINGERQIREQEKRKRMGSNYSPDTIKPGYVSEDQLDSMNEQFVNKVG